MVLGYRRGVIRGHAVKIVLRDRERFENSSTSEKDAEQLTHFYLKSVKILTFTLSHFNFLEASWILLAHISLAYILLDIGKQYSPKCDAAEFGVPSGASLFA